MSEKNVPEKTVSERDGEGSDVPRDTAMSGAQKHPAEKMGRKSSAAVPAARSASVFCCFPADDPVYAEHFPGAPCVPGSLLMQAFIRAAEQMTGPAPDAGQWTFTGVRFRKFVPPGTHVCTVSAVTDGSGSAYRCTLLVDGVAAVTGTIQCA